MRNFSITKRYAPARAFAVSRARCALRSCAGNLSIAEAQRHVEPELVEIWDQSGLKGVRALFERARAAVTKDVAHVPADTHAVVKP